MHQPVNTIEFLESKTTRRRDIAQANRAHVQLRTKQRRAGTKMPEVGARKLLIALTPMHLFKIQCQKRRFQVFRTQIGELTAPRCLVRRGYESSRRHHHR